MPIQSPQRNDYLNCPICDLQFGPLQRAPINLPCGHTFCYHCLYLEKTEKCPIDQTIVSLSADEAVVNTALLQLVGIPAPTRVVRPRKMSNLTEEEARAYENIIRFLESIALHLQPEPLTGDIVSQRLSRPMKRRILTILSCCLVDDDALMHIFRPIRLLAERIISELIMLYQNQGQISANLWAAVRARGCQFLGPGVQEEVLKLILLALEDGSALSRKVLVMFVVQRLEVHFSQASKTSIGHVVQLLYRASCFRVSKRVGDSSLMQLRDEFRTYFALRREHDSQIIQIAQESGLRIAPEQWSALLYGDVTHKSQMQSVIDKLQSPRPLAISVQELQLALHRQGNLAETHRINFHLPAIAALDRIEDGTEEMTWERLSLVAASLGRMLETLHEPLLPLMPQSMSHNGDDMLCQIKDPFANQDFDNEFGDQQDFDDQEFGDPQDYSDQYDDQQDGGYQQDHEDQYNDDQNYLDQEDHTDQYNDNDGNNGQDDEPPERLYNDELQNVNDYIRELQDFEPNDNDSDDDEEIDENGDEYGVDDADLYDDQEEQGNQQVPNDDPQRDMLPPQQFPGAMINQQPIFIPYRMPMMHPRYPGPFVGAYQRAWMPPNAFIQPYHNMQHMPGYIAPMRPIIPMANGWVRDPEGQNDDMEMARPAPPFEYLYNEANLVPVPYYQYLENINRRGPVLYHLAPNNGNDVAQVLADIPPPPAPEQDQGNNQAYNFGAMAAGLPDVAQFPAPIRGRPILGRHLPMVHMGPVFPAPMLPVGRFPAQVPGLIPIHGPVQFPGDPGLMWPVGQVRPPNPVAAPEQVPRPDEAPEQVQRPDEAPEQVPAPGPDAAAQEQEVAEENPLYEEDIAQSILFLERLLDVEYD